MDGAAIVIFAIVGIGIVVAAIAFGHAAQKKRREELTTLAAKLGWAFDPSSDSTHDDRYSQFSCFSRGHSRAAFNTITGRAEFEGLPFPAVMGDYTYKVTSSNGKTTSTRTYTFSYLILHLPWAGVPDLLIRRENLMDKLAGAIGFDDIDFESEEFSRRFHVKSPDKRFAYDVIHPRMMEFLMSGNEPAVEVRRGCICLTDGSRRWTPADFEAHLSWAGGFFRQWPAHLTSTLEAAR